MVRAHCFPPLPPSRDSQSRGFVTPYPFDQGGLEMSYIWAFIVGGTLCVIGQILIDKTGLTPARILVGYVVCGVILSAVGIYPRLVEFAGAGASVPLTGFGHCIAKGVKEAVAQDGFLGVLIGGLKATAGGITAAILAGVIVSLIFKAKDKS